MTDNWAHNYIPFGSTDYQITFPPKVETSRYKPRDFRPGQLWKQYYDRSKDDERGWSIYEIGEVNYEARTVVLLYYDLDHAERKEAGGGERGVICSPSWPMSAFDDKHWRKITD